MPESIQMQVHRITNHMQVVLGYLELEQYPKALVEVRAAISALHVLSSQVARLIVTRHMPHKSVVVVPHGTRVVSSEDVTVDIPTDSVSIVPEGEVRKGQGKHNRRTK
jgi:hypothetical protein